MGASYNVYTLESFTFFHVHPPLHDGKQIEHLTRSEAQKRYKIINTYPRYEIYLEYWEKEFFTLFFFAFRLSQGIENGEKRKNEMLEK